MRRRRPRRHPRDRWPLGARIAAWVLVLALLPLALFTLVVLAWSCVGVAWVGAGS